jgi:predicted NBD/HSP70 family sugar kinase
MGIRTRSEGSPNGAVPGDLRRHNRGLLLDLLSRHGAMSRKDIAAQARLTGAAISRIARELVDAGLVTEGEGTQEHAGRNGRGRPTVALQLAPGGGFVVGVGIGAYEQWVQIANLRGACVSRRALKLLGARTPARAITELAAQVRVLADEARIPRGRLLGVGVAIAGVVDPARAVVMHSPNIGWEGVALGESLARATRLPVVVEAMHHALNLAEARHGAMRGIADAVLVNAAMGIGASVMEEGRIVRGSHGAAGQIGHMRVAGAKELCTCGRRGCLDTVASGYAVLRRLGKAASRRTPGEHDAGTAQRLLAAIERERGGERAARAAFRACGEQLGDALNAVRAVFDPARIVLAGPLSQTGSYVEGVRASLGGEPQVFLATHSTDAAAANLALAQLAFGPQLDLARLRS